MEPIKCSQVNLSKGSLNKLILCTNVTLYVSLILKESYKNFSFHNIWINQGGLSDQVVTKFNHLTLTVVVLGSYSDKL